jgi:2-polyprenyl-3-methyl-5-hydroxy-6-metoxy-1,4-benzoquinol methylase
VTGSEIRSYQRQELSTFVSAQDYAGKRVLDYGCGAAPYRLIVEDGGGRWNGYNRSYYPGGAQVDLGPAEPLEQEWDLILCTQMLQYVPAPSDLLADFRKALSPGGRLVLTYATNWPEVETEDLFRFTRSGMELLLSGWSIEAHVALGEIPFGDHETLALGYGVVAIA